MVLPDRQRHDRHIAHLGARLMEGDPQFLQVTSNLPRVFKARFHGEEYEFRPGQAINLPIDACRHIFAFGEDDKSRALHRLGWLTLTNDMEAAMEKLNAVSFLPIEQVFELRGARPRRRQGALTLDGSAGAISNDRSPVNADESEGEGHTSPDESHEALSGQEF